MPGQTVYVQGLAYWQTDPRSVRETMQALGHAPRPQVLPAPAPSPAATAAVLAENPAKSAVPKIAAAAATAVNTPVPETKPAKAPSAKSMPLKVVPIKAAPVKAGPNKTLPGQSGIRPAPKVSAFSKVPLPKSGQPIIRVLNGCGAPGVCKLAADKLARQHVRLNPKNLTNAPNFNFTATQIKTNAKNLPWAHAIAKMLGIGENRIQIMPESVSYPAVTVVVGKDYPEWVK
ncbi:MAG: hypothetical protein HGA76_08335 [Candidatus Firestonebacteria bacterium]|nr:hypothetical protein [Candidatus Firestonebacteria bacterium]